MLKFRVNDVRFVVFTVAFLYQNKCPDVFNKTLSWSECCVWKTKIWYVLFFPLSIWIRKSKIISWKDCDTAAGNWNKLCLLNLCKFMFQAPEKLNTQTDKVYFFELLYWGFIFLLSKMIKHDTYCNIL